MKSSDTKSSELHTIRQLLVSSEVYLSVSIKTVAEVYLT